MKTYQISPGQIPHLVRLTADLFREMNNETTVATRCKPNEMHFVADLLKDLVDTAYPMEGLKNNVFYGKAKGEDSIDVKNLIKIAEFKSLDEAMDAIAKIMKDYKPPKAGEF